MLLHLGVGLTIYSLTPSSDGSKNDTLTVIDVKEVKKVEPIRDKAPLKTDEIKKKQKVTKLKQKKMQEFNKWYLFYC